MKTRKIPSPEWFQIILSFIIAVLYYSLAIAIPLLQTWRALLRGRNTKLWGMYWGIYALLRFFQGLLHYPHNLLSQSLEVIFIVWLYNKPYRGALWAGIKLNKLLKKNIHVARACNKIGQYINFLTVFERIPILKVKQKDPVSQ